MFGAFRQQSELRSVIRVFVNLPVVELHRANGLGGRHEPPPRRAEPRIGREVAVFVDPAGERRGSDVVTVARFQFRGRLGQRVTEIVEGDAVENNGER